MCKERKQVFRVCYLVRARAIGSNGLRKVLCVTLIIHWSTNFNFFFLAKTLTTDFHRVWAADSKSVLRFAPSHQVFELFDILYLSTFICLIIVIYDSIQASRELLSTNAL